MRAAIYFTPPAGDPLTRAASLWLGRDAFSGEPTRPLDAVLDPLVAEPARYGFHATMRAPFRLREGFGLIDVDAALARFAASRVTVPIAIRLLHWEPFFALVAAPPSAALAELEAAVVEAFEPFRAPLTPQEIEKRRPERLTERQRRNLDAFGYPHVLADFLFHMTLTGAVPKDQTQALETALAERFAAFNGAPLGISSLALFVEPAPGEPFRVHSLHPFGAD